MKRSDVVWIPSTTSSWLWGAAVLAPFAIGHLPFVLFASCYVGGSLAFGWIMGAPNLDRVRLVATIQTRYAGSFLLAQVLRLALLAAMALSYVFVPLVGTGLVTIVAAGALVAMAFAHVADPALRRRGDAVLLAIGLAAGATLMIAAGHAGGGASYDVVAARGMGEVGLIVPLVIGLLLGPWLDVQNWQQLDAMRAEKVSIRTVHAIGAGLQAILLFAYWFVARDASAIVSSLGLTAHGLSNPVAVSTIVWASAAVLPALIGSYTAIGRLLRDVTTKSQSPLLAFVPAGLAQTPSWCFLAALGLGLAASRVEGGILYVAAPVATLLVGTAACLALEPTGRRRGHDGALCAMIGLASLLVLVVGVVEHASGLVAVAPFIGLVGALPSAAPLDRGERPAAIARDAQVPARTTDVAIVPPPPREFSGHGFDDQWFVLHVTPTYDDTNSVGNVYFANYFRWVGKTRELFFDSCMPDFDIATSSFLVLTKSFHHEFRREVREFQPVFVKLRIGSYNRKFVTILHEIHSRKDGLIGRGEQTIMFVDRVHYRPLDIPAIVLQRFLPFYVPNQASSARVSATVN